MQYSIVKLSDVKTLTDSLRLDAEFFHPLNLSLDYNVRKVEHVKLSSVLSYNSRLGQPVYDNNSTCIVLNSQYIKNDDILYNQAKKGKNKSIIKINDILLTSTGVGTLGRVNIHHKNIQTTVDNHVTILRSSTVNHFYITAFLQSKYGQFQINRWFSGTSGQIEIYPKDIEQFLIPCISQDFQMIIEKLFKSSHSLKDLAKEQYKKAEDMLLEELGFKNYKLQHKLSYIKTFSEVKNEERLDAEYYQPKYEEIILKIKNKKYDLLSNLVYIKKCIEPGSNEYQEFGVPFIRVSNLSKFGLSTNNQKYLSESFYNANISHQAQQGEILLSKDGTVCVAYFLDSQPNKILCSGGILRLAIKKNNILPEYLTLLLNSVIVSSQAERDSGGALISHWLINSIENTVIPIIDDDKQKVICSLINASTKNRGKSNKLLEIATKAVEMAIEQNEDLATEWIHSQIQAIDVQI